MDKKQIENFKKYAHLRKIDKNDPLENAIRDLANMYKQKEEKKDTDSREIE